MKKRLWTCWWNKLKAPGYDCSTVWFYPGLFCQSCKDFYDVADIPKPPPETCREMHLKVWGCGPVRYVRGAQEP